MTHDEISSQMGTQAVSLARDALKKYVNQQQRLQIGSKAGELYRRCGVFVRITDKKSGKLYGGAASFRDNKQLGESIIDAVITAASERRGNDRISKQQLDRTLISICLIDTIHLIDSLSEVDNFRNPYIPVILDKNSQEWIYPEVAIKNDWSIEQYIERTERISTDTEFTDISDGVIFLEVRCFKEISPNGLVKEISCKDDISDNKSGWTP